jgi:hypothetical protein
LTKPEEVRMLFPRLSATSGKYSIYVLLLLLRIGKRLPDPSIMEPVAWMRYVLPDCQLLFFRCSRKRSKPPTRLCDPALLVERK